jgi:hypothetical protein
MVMRRAMKTIEISLPIGFMNCGVTENNTMVADPNSSENWFVIEFPLPTGKWKIHSYHDNNQKVKLISR